MSDIPTPQARMGGRLNEIQVTIERKLHQVAHTINDLAWLEEIGREITQMIGQVEQTIITFGEEIDQKLDEWQAEAFRPLREQETTEVEEEG